MEHTQRYLDTLTKAERGELWIKGVLAKEPNYNVDDLKDIWEQTQNTHETYEQEADKIKWMDDKLTEAMQSEPIRYNSLDDLFDDVEREALSIIQKKQKQIA